MLFVLCFVFVVLICFVLYVGCAYVIVCGLFCFVCRLRCRSCFVLLVDLIGLQCGYRLVSVGFVLLFSVCLFLCCCHCFCLCDLGLVLVCFVLSCLRCVFDYVRLIKLFVLFVCFYVCLFCLADILLCLCVLLCCMCVLLICCCCFVCRLRASFLFVLYCW